MFVGNFSTIEKTLDLAAAQAGRIDITSFRVYNERAHLRNHRKGKKGAVDFKTVFELACL